MSQYPKKTFHFLFFELWLTYEWLCAGNSQWQCPDDCIGMVMFLKVYLMFKSPFVTCSLIIICIGYVKNVQKG